LPNHESEVGPTTLQQSQEESPLDQKAFIGQGIISLVCQQTACLIEAAPESGASDVATAAWDEERSPDVEGAALDCRILRRCHEFFGSLSIWRMPNSMVAPRRPDDIEQPHRVHV
jgi:hypothetical protein